MKALHLFGGLGGGARGFVDEGFDVAGAVDFEPGACADFRTIVGAEETCADLHEMTPVQLRACSDRPDVVFTSPPCKGMSGCLSKAKAESPAYQRMNELTFRGVWLALEAWHRKPPQLLLLENVPKILSRGAAWLERIEAMLRGYGYAVTRSTHDCGEIGGLAQHRRRFLLVARHVASCPPFLRVPPTQRVRGIGEVLGELPVPLPGGTEGGAMHRLPKLAPINWVRLALIPAGKDWRALKSIERVELHHRAGRQNGQYGVEPWSEPAHAVLGHSSARDTFASIADPRLTCERREGGHGVKAWDDASSPIIGNASIDNFPCQVADPRLAHEEFRSCRGVQRWAEPSHTIRAHHNVNNSAASVADPRIPIFDGPPVDLASRRAIWMVIRAADGTWHRPMTTLELAALQSLPVRDAAGEWLVLVGNDQDRREKIGNAVPTNAARAIARSCKATLALAAGGSWRLDNGEIWVREGDAR